MAQIQRIAAGQGISVPGQVQHEPVQTPLSNATAAAEGAAQLGATVANIAHDVASEYAQRQIQLQRTTQYNQKSSEASLSIDAFLRQQEQTPYDFADPDQSDAYEKATTAGVDKIISQTLEKVKDPVVRAQLQGHLLGEREQAIYRSRAYSRTQVIDAGRAALTQALGADANRAIDASTGPEFSIALQSITDRLNQAEADGLLTKVQRQDQMQNMMASIETVRTDRQIQHDPVAALHELSDEARTGTMDPVRRQQLVDQALTELSRREADNDKIRKQQRETVITGLIAAAHDDQLTATQLNGFIQPLSLTREEYQAIRTVIDRPEKTGDPAIIQQGTIGVNTNSPALRVTQGWLDAHAAELGSQYAPLSATLRSRTDHDQDTTDKTKSDARYRHTQAEQLVRESLRTQGPLESINPVGQQTLAEALTELTQRSAAYDGTEDPLAVAHDVVAKYLPKLRSTASARVKVIRGSLQYQSVSQLGTREQARARGMSDSQYNEQVRKIGEVEDMEAELKRMQAEIQQSGKAQ